MSKNTEILEILEGCNGDENAAQVKEIIGLWDKSENFPVDQAKRYIKMQEWSYNKFGFSMEFEIAKTLPKWFLKVFFDMKEFKSNPRNELTSSCEALSKINGYPMTTQEDKAFCQYDYSLRKYFEEV
jgi:hypothetical protein